MSAEQLVQNVTREVSRTFFIFGGIAGLIVGAAAALLLQDLLS